MSSKVIPLLVVLDCCKEGVAEVSTSRLLCSVWPSSVIFVGASLISIASTTDGPLADVVAEVLSGLSMPVVPEIPSTVVSFAESSALALDSLAIDEEDTSLAVLVSRASISLLAFFVSDSEVRACSEVWSPLELSCSLVVGDSAEAMVCDDTIASDDAMVSGDAKVSGDSIVSGDDMVSGDAVVSDNTVVSSDTVVPVDLVVSDDRVSSDEDDISESVALVSSVDKIPEGLPESVFDGDSGLEDLVSVGSTSIDTVSDVGS